MKKLLFIFIVCVMATMAGQTQKLAPDKVPSPVKQSFKTRFPAAGDVRYHKEKMDYKVKFKDNGASKSAHFDAAGKWLETETSIKGTELPKEVLASVAKNFAGYLISDAVKVETPGLGLIYELDLNKDKETYEVRFSSGGEVLKKTELAEEGDEDEDD